jgi:hypothetical protein
MGFGDLAQKGHVASKERVNDVLLIINLFTVPLNIYIYKSPVKSVFNTVSSNLCGFLRIICIQCVLALKRSEPEACITPFCLLFGL